MHAYKGQQRSLQFGTGSVEQRAEGGGIPHEELVGVSREDVADAQKSLHVGRREEVREAGRKLTVSLCSVFVLPAAARRGQGGRESDDLSRRRDAAAVSGLQLSPETHTHTRFRAVRLMLCRNVT